MTVHSSHEYIRTYITATLHVNSQTGQAGEHNAHAPATALAFFFVFCKSYITVFFEQ